MKKTGLGILMSLIILGVAGAAMAMLVPASDQGRQNSKAENSPIIEKAGDNLVLSPPGLEKIVHIHYAKDFAKPPAAGNGNSKPRGEASCYTFSGNGAKWQNLPVSYVVDPALESAAPGAFSAAAETWDNAISAELFANNYSVESGLTWDGDAGDVPDGRNEMLFGAYGQKGVIAVTVVWGYFSGKPEARKIIESDILFNSDFAPWGDALANPAAMDLQNIATHELGHVLGLGDVYESACGAVTMYGYSDFGETVKRTLEQADLTGLKKLYGV